LFVVGLGDLERDQTREAVGVERDAELRERETRRRPLRDEEEWLGARVVAELDEQVGLVLAALLVAAREGLAHAVETLRGRRPQRRGPLRRRDGLPLAVPVRAVRGPAARQVDARAGIAVVVEEDEAALG